jgi:hypothetical protein
MRRMRSGSGAVDSRKSGSNHATTGEGATPLQQGSSSQTWVMRTLFRTAENERGPSRVRPRGTLFH